MKTFVIILLWFYSVVQIQCRFSKCVVFIKEERQSVKCSIIRFNNDTSIDKPSNISISNKTFTFETLFSITNNNLSDCQIYSHTQVGSSLSLIEEMFRWNPEEVSQVSFTYLSLSCVQLIKLRIKTKGKILL